MAFTHYPKIETPSWGEALWFGQGDPRNTLFEPLAAKGTAVLWGSAVNFTRYYGSIHSDQPVEVAFDFAGDSKVLVQKPGILGDLEVDQSLPENIRHFYPARNGLRDVTDEDLKALHYDARAIEVSCKANSSAKFVVTIYGLYLRVTARNLGESPAHSLRLYVFGSVF